MKLRCQKFLNVLLKKDYRDLGRYKYWSRFNMCKSPVQTKLFPQGQGCWWNYCVWNSFFHFSGNSTIMNGWGQAVLPEWKEYRGQKCIIRDQNDLLWNDICGEWKRGENNIPISFLLTFNILPVILGDKSSWYPNSNGTLVFSLREWGA